MGSVYATIFQYVGAFCLLERVATQSELIEALKESIPHASFNIF